MPHAKFQHPSINIDRYFQLSSGERKGERKKERKKEREKERKNERKKERDKDRQEGFISVKIDLT